ncbi:FecR domain-containing protein [Cellvibrio sp. PSBB006]|jgi:transmembrane sensor|uniref:FecR family protein n=1 Tax=Cellvibrio sp. PSBB006 TaxID=1987723 RepID=UPI000B3B2453|nr:FecR domain-containing protein [Cellvibrio sp. PSBB006]ARU29158.1 hypothetical protein CBR65_17905 [Cellvibrio sp. PSBB006]
MNQSVTEKKTRRAIKAEAALWFAKLRAPECDAELQLDFDTWLKENPAHELAYEQCCTLWLMTNNLRDDEDIQRELVSARQELEPGYRQRSIRLNNPGNWLAYAAVMMLFCIGFIFSINYLSEEEFSTRVGEQRLVQLPDGSTAMLNTDTVISVHYSGKKRRIRLRQGEAYFDVHKDNQRPFEVSAAGSVVRALGTEFNVAIREQTLSVDVADGVVELRSKNPLNTDQSIITEIREGEAVNYKKGDEATKVEAARLARISAWQTRKIYFDADTLADAVAEYNRYITEKITVVDNELNQQRITGIFHLGDLDTFIFSLEQALNARVERSGKNILVMKGLDLPAES